MLLLCFLILSSMVYHELYADSYRDKNHTQYCINKCTQTRTLTHSYALVHLSRPRPTQRKVVPTRPDPIRPAINKYSAPTPPAEFCKKKKIFDSTRTDPIWPDLTRTDPNRPDLTWTRVDQTPAQHCPDVWRATCSQRGDPIANENASSRRGVLEACTQQCTCTVVVYGVNNSARVR